MASARVGKSSGNEKWICENKFRVFVRPNPDVGRMWDKNHDNNKVRYSVS